METTEIGGLVKQRTSFQHKCEEALHDFLKMHGLILQQRTEREVKPSWSNHSYTLISGKIQEWEIWIHDDQVDLISGEEDKILESASYRSEDEHVKAFIASLEKLILRSPSQR